MIRALGRGWRVVTPRRVSAVVTHSMETSDDLEETLCTQSAGSAILPLIHLIKFLNFAPQNNPFPSLVSVRCKINLMGLVIFVIGTV